MSVEHEIKMLKDKVDKLEKRVTQLELQNQPQTPPPNEGSSTIIYHGRVR